MTGTYQATIIGHVLAESKNKGTPSIKFKLMLDKDIMTGEKVSGTVYYDAWLSEKAFDNTMKTLVETLGWAGTDLNDFNGTGKFIDMVVSVVCEDELYEGVTRTKVKFMNSLDRVAEVKPMDTGAARSLGEQMKARIMAYRQSNARPAPKPEKNPEPKQPAKERPVDPDMPF